MVAILVLDGSCSSIFGVPARTRGAASIPAAAEASGNFRKSRRTNFPSFTGTPSFRGPANYVQSALINDIPPDAIRKVKPSRRVRDIKVERFTDINKTARILAYT